MTGASGVPSVVSHGLGKRYGSTWALRECSLTIPRGRITALVGPNGAGKTTLLRLLVGLSRPSTGEVSILGRSPGQSEEFLASVGYLAQDVPLYGRLSADDHLEIGARLNRHWDTASAKERLHQLRIPSDRPVSTLSGGQRAQVGLGVALAKRPQLLLLDEPVAALDPLARRQFLSSLAEAVAEDDLSVVMSSHLLHDLERVCDHIVLLSDARTQLCEDIDSVLSTHRVLIGPRRPVVESERGLDVVKSTHTHRQSRLLVRTTGPVADPSWEVHEAGLEDVILAYMGQDDEVLTSPMTVIGAAG